MTKHLVSYDIIEDKRRNKVSKLLKDYGIRVQYSVFEIFVDQKKLVTIANRLEKLINTKTDSVRIYKIYEDFGQTNIVIGKNNIIYPTNVLIL